MKKVAVILAQYGNPEWLALCIHGFKTYGIPVESELIVVDNSPDSPWIKVLTETSLGEGVKIVEGNRDFTSHAYGYKLGYESTDADWIFTAESDSFPTRCGWFDEYVKASVNHDMIGPEMPMASGTFIHPAGSLVSRKLLNVHKSWQDSISDWKFVPAGAIELGLSGMGYHAVVSDEFLRHNEVCIDTAAKIHLWRDVGNWQEMRSFDDDSFDTYGQRTGIKHWHPRDGRQWHLRVGYEPGQGLSYFAQAHGFNILKAPTEIKWMDNMDGRQAAYSTVFGGFCHIWAGTVTCVSAKDMAPDVVKFKYKQRDDMVAQLPDEVRNKISQLRA